MTNTMTYKGYSARIDYDDDDRVFTGRIAASAMGSAFTPITWKPFGKPFMRPWRTISRPVPGSESHRRSPIRAG